MPLDRGLPVRRAVDDDRIEDRVDDGENAEQRGQPPVHVDRRRHQEQDADGGRRLLAQEAEPGAEQRVGAGHDGAHHGAGADLGVIADRQRDRALERAAHGGQPLAVREPVGHHGDDHAGQDAEQAEPRPLHDDRRRVAVLGQRIDDAAEQDLLVDLDHGDASRRPRPASAVSHFSGARKPSALKVDAGQAHAVADLGRSARQAGGGWQRRASQARGSWWLIRAL